MRGGSFPSFAGRPGAPEKRAQHQTHGTHTWVPVGWRTRFCPVKLLPLHSSTSTPEVDSPPHNQHSAPGGSAWASAATASPRASTVGLPTWR